MSPRAESAAGEPSPQGAPVRDGQPPAQPQPAAPAISLPKGGGAIRGIGEKFAANPVTGTASTSVPIPTSPGRSGFGPQLSLSYDSGAGNGPFGFGWTLPAPAITRKTDKGLPTYQDTIDADVFLMPGGGEDLVAVRAPDGSVLEDPSITPGFTVRRYRPRIEAGFARIECWTEDATGDTHWRSITRDDITTLYGTTNDSRIVDPDDSNPVAPSRVFSWLICETFDDKGNTVQYIYKREDSTGVSIGQVHEATRTPARRSANRYLKHIRYGNTVSRLDSARWPDNRWLFELVLDYGEHDALKPTPGDPGEWICRNDPFSSYRPGFEVRTYRLCQRFLMFHHFPAEDGVGDDCLVRSLDLRYIADREIASDAQLGNPVASFIESVTSAGYRHDDTGGYVRRSIPAVQFSYSEAVIDDTVQTVDPASLANLPVGIDASTYQWLDLFGEGVAGILTEQTDAWSYKRNLSPAADPGADGTTPVSLAAVEQIARRPNVSLAGMGAQLMDLAGDGQPDIVTIDGPMAGFFEVEDDEQWSAFQPFVSRPTISLTDPDVRLIDLNGDGHADVLVTDDETLTWYPSLGEDGFAAPISVPRPKDEQTGPAVVFDDGIQSIHLADMSGDGLTDIVRIRSGEVCYWPNLGYARFGAQVTMDNSPWFAAPDSFQPSRVLIADINGSGTVDILYLDGDGVRVYFNQSGNAWTDARELLGFPAIDDIAAVSTVDLLGNGTACLVWSSALPGDAGRQMRYVDLMGGQKPHLLTKIVNNLGAETTVTYASSAKFYLRDKLAGRPWITKLPFPVHVVERVDTLDRISGNAFTTRYAYHHGHFDGDEREFRGFGMVEQWDTEQFAALADSSKPAPTNVDEASHVPPARTKTWFHTGAFLDRDRISNFYAGLSDTEDTGEYYREPAWRTNDTEARRRLLPDTVLPDTVLLSDGTRTAHTLTPDEEREACRALRGSMLRQELCGLDDTPLVEHPYTVLEQNFTVELLQPRGGDRHAVFFVHPREVLEHHYERTDDDPRVSHNLTLDVDAYANVLRTASVAYGRRQPDPEIEDPDDRIEQTLAHITCSERHYTNPVTTPTAWRAPLLSESLSYELTALDLTPDALRFTFDELNTAVATGTTDETAATPGTPRKRLIEHTRTRYRPDDLGTAQADPLGLLALGTLQSLAIPGETLRLALTARLVTDIYGARVTDAMLQDEGRYVHSDGDSDWWIPSGRTFLSPAASNTAEQELAFAREHFYLPRRYRDPFHTTNVPTETRVDYDRYDLLVLQTRDALGNTVTAGERDPAGALTISGNDYRVLTPRLMMDANRNRAAVAHDALGMVTATAVMGKPAPAPVEGDSLTGLEPDLAEPVVLAQIATPLDTPEAVLKRASTRLLYDLFAYQRTQAQPQPQAAVTYTLARETHDSERVPAGGLKIQHAFAYSDGFGREIQRKIQAEPGPGPKRNPDGEIIVGGDGQPELTADLVTRWVGSGWTVFNNKAKPVRQYEPFFTDTHHFEFDVRIGVSPVLFYDPLGRAVATLHPNHAWEKVAFGPWRQETWDANDTVDIADPAADRDVGDYFKRLPDADYLPTWGGQRQAGGAGPEQDAARRATVHARTPTIAHADSLGRAYLTIAHNKTQYTLSAAATPTTEEHHRTRVIFDIQGNQRSIIDALGRVVMRYDYDALSTRIHQASMEAGARWTLNDAAGKPLYAWDSRDHRFHTSYDALGRPTGLRLQDGAAPEVLIGSTLYGEARADADAGNLRGRAVHVFDQAGIATTNAYDFKGNLLRSGRQLASEYKATLDWSAAVQLDRPTYIGGTRYDALNRPTQQIAPHSDQPGATVNVTQPSYNEANLLNQIDVWLEQPAEPAGALPPATADLHAVTNIDYDAKGQRCLIEYGNGTRTTYTHDPLTLRLTHLLTGRGAAVLQDLHYTYDPVGNITQIRDDAQQTIFFSNQVVEPNCEYNYDAVYRLIEATGREHLGQVGAPPTPSSYNDAPRVGITFAATDGRAMARYLERYVYDVAGNFETMKHVTSNPANPGWTRTFSCREPSQLEPGQHSNRLTSAALRPSSVETYSTNGDGYDAHGNMLRMPHLQELRWDFKDQLRMTRRQRVKASDADGVEHHGERTWYVYDGAGQRVRKVTELSDGALKDERVYLGGFEIFRRAGAKTLVRGTLHIMDDKQRIALVETRTEGREAGVPRQLVRFQFGNHLGSASLGLDQQARLISYEEYTPYGSTSYQAVRSQTETPKRYRYTAKERDDESGLSYHGARYYAAWIGRWTSCDPAGLVDGPQLYAYAAGNPIRYQDPGGKTAEELQAAIDRTSEYAWNVVQLNREVTSANEEIARLTETYSEAQGRYQAGLSKTGYGDAKVADEMKVAKEALQKIHEERLPALQNRALSLNKAVPGTSVPKLTLEGKWARVPKDWTRAEQVTAELEADLAANGWAVVKDPELGVAAREAIANVKRAESLIPGVVAEAAEARQVVTAAVGAAADLAKIPKIPGRGLSGGRVLGIAGTALTLAEIATADTPEKSQAVLAEAVLAPIGLLFEINPVYLGLKRWGGVDIYNVAGRALGRIIPSNSEAAKFEAAAKRHGEARAR